MSAALTAALKTMRERQADWKQCRCPQCKSSDTYNQTECRRYIAFVNAHEDAVRIDPTIRERADAIGHTRVKA